MIFHRLSRRCGGCANSVIGTNRVFCWPRSCSGAFGGVARCACGSWIALLGDGVLHGNRGRILTAAIGLGVSATATWLLRTVSTRVQRRFRDKVTIALESHVARLQASASTIAHHERPDYLDRLAMLRNQVFVLDHVHVAVFYLRMDSAARHHGGSAGINTPGADLLAVFALPTLWTSTWRPEVERNAWESQASSHRLARHLFTTATTAPPGKEVRVTGMALD